MDLFMSNLLRSTECIFTRYDHAPRIDFTIRERHKRWPMFANTINTMYGDCDWLMVEYQCADYLDQIDPLELMCGLTIVNSKKRTYTVVLNSNVALLQGYTTMGYKFSQRYNKDIGAYLTYQKIRLLDYLIKNQWISNINQFKTLPLLMSFQTPQPWQIKREVRQLFLQLLHWQNLKKHENIEEAYGTIREKIGEFKDAAINVWEKYAMLPTLIEADKHKWLRKIFWFQMEPKTKKKMDEIIDEGSKPSEGHKLQKVDEFIKRQTGESEYVLKTGLKSFTDLPHNFRKHVKKGGYMVRSIQTYLDEEFESFLDLCELEYLEKHDSDKFQEKLEQRMLKKAETLPKEKSEYSDPRINAIAAALAAEEGKDDDKTETEHDDASQERPAIDLGKKRKAAIEANKVLKKR